MHASYQHANRRMRRRQLAWLALVACGLGMTCASAQAADELAEPEVAIESAGDSLASRPKLPWYDPRTDDFRPAEVQPPRTRTPTNTNLGLAELLLRLGWLLLAALLVYLVYLIARAFLNQEVSDSVVVQRGPAGADISRVEELPIALKKSPADYLDEAQRLYRRGDYGQAIVYLFSHQLLQLDRRHWLRLIKGKTNRQYVREVRRGAAANAGQIATIFEATVVLFEEVFFGKRLPPQDRIDAVWNDIDRFEALVAPVEEKAA